MSLACAQPGAPTPPPPPARSAQAMVIQRGAGGGYLGIGGMEVTADKVKALGLKEEGGVLVSSVAEDGPAARAGVKDGDVVLEFNGTPVQGTVQFQRMVGETPPGRQVKLTVWRNGATQTVTATIGERKNMVTTIMPEDGRNWSFDMPGMPSMPAMPRFEAISPNPALGIYGEPLGENEQLAEFFGVTDGVLVRSVRKGSAADKAGIKAGDVITKVEDSRVSASPDITRALRNARGKKTSVVVTVVRNKKEMPITVTLETSPVGSVWDLFNTLNG
ncbi:MAG TPA: PDZ domain-containing protein [Candidatus Acidoferrum sp.]|nr:PDZ domain-containing protein [Candidatus Acidoferrum sp.]